MMKQDEARKTILLLDNDEFLLESLKMVVEYLVGYSTLTARSMDEVISLGSKVLLCDMAVLDINLGADQPSGIDVYRWLRVNAFNKAIIFLSGHGRGHPVVDTAWGLEDVKVYSNPIDIDEFIEIIKKRTHDE